MNETKQNRFRSWALWTSVAALVVFCVKEFAGIDISDTVNGFLNVLLPVLVAFGIVNNPTDRANF
ncbi:MAG: holin [Lachnospiraceae bacterium]|nr:holin [Lachnospiraceae bacterium]